jgi:hypothetical protein
MFFLSNFTCNSGLIDGHPDYFAYTEAGFSMRNISDHVFVITREVSSKCFRFDGGSGDTASRPI